MLYKRLILLILFSLFTFVMIGCDEDSSPTKTEEPPMATDPDTAPKASIDRFSPDAATLFVRSGSNGLPATNAPIDFDQAPFITKGLGPNGEVVRYYNFDVQPVQSAPIFALFREGESTPVEGQLNIIGVIPGDAGYSDFWHVHKVTVPADYVANTITNVSDLMSSGYTIERTNMIVNCPVVPEGSTADLRYKPNEEKGLVRGWYNDRVVFYFNFIEKELIVEPPATGSPNVPLAEILVTFNINPDQPGGGPASGFVTEGSSDQTHNVVDTLPEDAGYSPLWDVDVYDNADFNKVYDWQSATMANILDRGVAIVNCPIVSVEEGNPPLNPDTAPKASIDRFSSDAGTLFVRDGSNGLPEANAPINFDQGPFITKGLGPNGEHVQYYNFDVQPVQSAPIFALFREGENTPVEGQLNIVDVIPGDTGYNDFWHVHKVTVPDYYVANTITNVDELMESGYTIERTNMIVNCPIVPEGSTANLRYAGEDNGLVRGWYKDQVVFYFNFVEKALIVEPPATGHPNVPIAEILVSFNINPDQPGGGPPSGFMTEEGTDQTHNVIDTLPEDPGYSPYWDVDVYDNADFDNVMDWQSASMANILARGVALVNCPVVSVQ